MAFDVSAAASQHCLKIAVIGSGISGLSAAWLLAERHRVTLYERAGVIGGHANTVDVPVGEREVPVDAGFIVFNRPNYPNLTALFEHLDVTTEQSCMSFAASMRGGALEYSGQTLSSVFANRSNAVSPAFWRMLADIVRFHREARAALHHGLSEDVSLQDFVKTQHFGKSFSRDFLTPMASAIWSTPSANILDYPALSFFRFFDNHGLLQVLNMPIWHTVRGGAREYVKKIAAPFASGARLRTPAAQILRDKKGVLVTDASGHEDRFDHVVIATHADAALAMLTDANEDERVILGAFKYQPNRAYVHFDETQMPKKKRAWSSWNYMGGDGETGKDAGVTYWMNRLQNLSCGRNIFVTLNPQTPIRDDAIVAAFDYDHPVFDVKAGAAQKRLWSLQGRGGVWFCGAHFGHGFHEDGLQSGLAVAEALGGRRRPWSVADESGRIHLPAAPAVMAAE